MPKLYLKLMPKWSENEDETVKISIPKSFFSLKADFAKTVLLLVEKHTFRGSRGVNIEKKTIQQRCERNVRKEYAKISENCAKMEPTWEPKPA